MENNLTFRNRREASEHAQNLLNSGQINLDEYRQIPARAEKEARLPESASGRWLCRCNRCRPMSR